MACSSVQKNNCQSRTTRYLENRELSWRRVEAVGIYLFKEWKKQRLGLKKILEEGIVEVRISQEEYRIHDEGRRNALHDGQTPR